MEGTIDETAKAHFEDRELPRRFLDAQQVPECDKEIVKELLSTFLTKWQLQTLTARQMAPAVTRLAFCAASACQLGITALLIRR